MTASLDHGELNLPLKQRGVTDAQLDRYKREQFAILESGMREARKAHKGLVAAAKLLIEQVSDERMAELGAPHGLTAKQCRKEWRSIASMKPALVITAMRKELNQ